MFTRVVVWVFVEAASVLVMVFVLASWVDTIVVG